MVRYNTDGSLDNTFGNGGIVITNYGNFNNEINSLAIQPDGKIVGSGIIINNFGSNYHFILIRYNPDGSLDDTFRSNGIASVLNNHGYTGHTVLLQNDGKIVLGGNCYNGSLHFALVRFNADGSLDNTFGTNGFVITFRSQSSWQSNAVMQNDGKIVMAGFTQTDSGYNFCLIRYNTDGNLDYSFGTDGVVVTSTGASHCQGYFRSYTKRW